MTWPRKYDQIPAQQLHDWIAAGLNLKQMAALVGTHASVIRRALRYRRIPYTPQRRRVSKLLAIDPDELRRLYCDERLTQAQIGGQLGLSSSTITEAMRIHGIPARKGSRRYNQRRPWHDPAWLAQEMLAKTYPRIAAECGCHVQTIVRAAHSYGLIKDNHPRRAARAHAHQIIRDAYHRALPVLPPGPPADFPDCPAWLIDIMTEASPCRR